MNYEVFKNELLQKPGIESVSATDYLPGTGVVYREFVDCEKLPDSTVIGHLTVDPDFIKTADIKLIAGDDFGANSENNPGSHAIINEAAVRYLGFKNVDEALEYTISIGKDLNIQIIGVVRNFVIQSTDFEPDPLVIRVIPDHYNYAFIRILPGRTGDELISSIGESWKKLNPEQLFRNKYYSEHIENYQYGSVQMVQVLGFITFLTVFISILGLLGMVVFNSENRINEIGIRKVVGSNNAEILWEISRGFVFMMGLAVLIATPLAWFIGKMILQNIYNRITLKPGFFAVGILFLLLIGAITVFSQTWKAANRNPVDSLRYE